MLLNFCLLRGLGAWKALDISMGYFQLLKIIKIFVYCFANKE